MAYAQFFLSARSRVSRYILSRRLRRRVKFAEVKAAVFRIAALVKAAEANRIRDLHNFHGECKLRQSSRTLRWMTTVR